MIKKTLLIAIIAFFLSHNDGHSCSTFMLKSGSEHIFGHNLDIGGNMPGMVFINKRGTQKTGHTWGQLSSAFENRSSGISWTSQYGSVTFNAFGRELPDGGMNEMGLYIWEMTGKNSLEEEEKRPRLFMSQWMQYQLDNFKSVEEVLANLPAIGLDGWNWHFFVADKQGETAAIEFINGIPIVNTKDNMPVPVMGNGRYTDDLSFLKEFEGFGGNIAIDVDDPNIPGFVKASEMIKKYKSDDKIEDYGFKILEQFSGKVSKWAIIYDVKNMSVHFRTALYPEIKTFSIRSIDFSQESPVMILNIQDSTLSGDVNDYFQAFSDKENIRLVSETCEKIYQADEFEISKDTLIYRLANAYKTANVPTIGNLAGKWEGYAVYPTTGEPARVDWLIELQGSGKDISGKITDSAGLLSDTKLRNIRFKNGIFQFTVYSYGYVFKIYGKVSNTAIEGIFDISDESRKGNFYVQLTN